MDGIFRMVIHLRNDIDAGVIGRDVNQNLTIVTQGIVQNICSQDQIVLQHGGIFYLQPFTGSKSDRCFAGRMRKYGKDGNRERRSIGRYNSRGTGDYGRADYDSLDSDGAKEALKHWEVYETEMNICLGRIYL